MPAKAELFCLENVTKSFGEKEDKVTALDQVNLSIYEGEIFGIIGMSGAGKSTLVRTLNRLEEISDGSIFFAGQNLQALSDRELRHVRQSMAMVFQNFNLLLQKSVLDNVMLPMKIAGKNRKEQRKKALEVLKIVGLEERAKAYPAQLSGGQRQRVAIARALTMEPKVLLCDEATSALDPKITDEILKLLQNINKNMGITIVMITHEMSVVEKICDRVAIIDQGKLAEIGNVKDIFTNPQTEVARHLIFPQREELNAFEAAGGRYVRIVFDGRAASEPLIANLVQETGQKVNILCANTKSVGGIGYGQMIVELPEDETSAEQVMAYLKKHGVTVSEVKKEVNDA
ncbi:MAG: methionine ABC transporter ATP-binding protein [Lachnospiraceae bacterium]